MVIHRGISFVLFLGGIFFALFAWLGLGLPGGIIFAEYRYTTRDTVLSLSAFGLALSGYFIWGNWLQIARGKMRSPQRIRFLWFLSLLNHLGWMIFFPFLRRQWAWQTVEELPWIFCWLILNLAVAAVCLVVIEEDFRGKCRKIL